MNDLLARTAASRVTLREDLPGDYVFPVTHEALAPGVGSLKEERTVDLRNQPVAREVAAGRQVVQHDCATAYDDPAFHRMRASAEGKQERPRAGPPPAPRPPGVTPPCTPRCAAGRTTPSG